MKRYLAMAAGLLCLAVLPIVTGCAAVTAVKTGQPLNPDQVKIDLDTASYLLKATGCITEQAATVAAPIVSIAGDAEGNQVLSAVQAAGAVPCTVTVPPMALPIPAPANAAPAAAAAK